MLIKVSEAKKQLTEFQGWRVRSTEMTKVFEFADFHQSMDFVNQVAVQAIKFEHHPDIDIRYNRVKITLTTHDEGGITQKDVEVTKAIEQI